MNRYLLLSVMLFSGTLFSQDFQLTAPVVVVTAGPQANETGAGMVIGHRGRTIFLITAFHVVKNFPELITVEFQGSNIKIESEIHFSVLDHDLAVLSLTLPPSIEIPASYLPVTSAPNELEKVIVIGHPNNSTWDVNLAATIKTWDIRDNYTRSKFHVDDTGIGNGNSGGPVLNEERQFLGMVLKITEAKAICLRGSLILTILEAENIPINLLTGIEVNISSYNSPFANTMIWIEGGTFRMGSSERYDNEKPIHQVTLDGFWMGKFEVTNKQFCAFLNEKGNQTQGGTTWLNLESAGCDITRAGSRFMPKSGKSTHPVREVSWYGAQAYTQWLTQITGHTYRLPTEAQWEFAARGGNLAENTLYAGSNSVNDVGWSDNNSRSTTQAIGQKAANELQLHDMSGNVWEWCSDWYSATYYSSSPTSNPAGPSRGTQRSLRGGSWDSSPRDLRIALRKYRAADHRDKYTGFRLARTP